MATMKMPITIGTGGGDLGELFYEAAENGTLCVRSGSLSYDNWTTDKAYKTVWLWVEGSSATDSYIKRGSAEGSSAFDAVYSSAQSGFRIYRFDNVASGTVIGTIQPTWAGGFIAFE